MRTLNTQKDSAHVMSFLVECKTWKVEQKTFLKELPATHTHACNIITTLLAALSVGTLQTEFLITEY